MRWMYIEINVSTIYTSDFNACLVVPLTSLKLKLLVLRLICSSHPSTELTFIMEVTFALRCFHHHLHACKHWNSNRRPIPTLKLVTLHVISRQPESLSSFSLSSSITKTQSFKT
jgi:hypothetical protein